MVCIAAAAGLGDGVVPRNATTTTRRTGAQHQNAVHSGGPKTKEGRRRSALNSRQMAVPKLAREIIERLKGDPEDFVRIWRDVLAIFWFMGSELEPFLDGAAWDWWLKQHYARNGGANELTMRAIDVRLERRLHDLVSAYRMVNRKWQDRLESELGTAGRVGMWHLRLAVETRLKPYQELVRSGKLPKVSPLELAIDRWSPEIWDLDAPLTDLGDEDEDGADFKDRDDYDEFSDKNELIGFK